MMMKFN